LIQHCNPAAVSLREIIFTVVQQALFGHAIPKRKIRLETAEEANLKACPNTSVIFHEVNEESDEEED
jgi:hypothetical protein